MSGWCEVELTLLELMVGDLMDTARDIFERCQSSGMETSKVHSLDHLFST